MPCAIKRFIDKVVIDPATGCWEWQGSRNEHGYGFFWHKGKARKAHRVALELLAGYRLRRRDVVLHKCDNRACIRPGHLEVGNQARNCWGRAAKGRHPLQQDPQCQERDSRGRFVPSPEQR